MVQCKPPTLSIAGSWLNGLRWKYSPTKRGFALGYVVPASLRTMSMKSCRRLIAASPCSKASITSRSRTHIFFSIVRNLLLRRLKRQRIVPFETIAEIESFQDDRPSPEQVIGSKLAYEKVLALIADLPERCRHIVQLRKIEGWSQREIAEHLGTTEKAVEKQIWIGIRAVREAWRLSNQTDESARPARDYREGHR